MPYIECRIISQVFTEAAEQAEADSSERADADGSGSAVELLGAVGLAFESSLVDRVQPLPWRDLMSGHQTSPEELRRYYRDMLLIRRFEEKAEEGYAIGKIGGFCHLHIGQEAAAAGSILPLRPDDYIISAYREHTQALAKGVEPGPVMAELYGRAGGASGGKGKRGVRANGRDLRELPLMRMAYERWPALQGEIGAPTGYERTGHLQLIERPRDLTAAPHQAWITPRSSIAQIAEVFHSSFNSPEKHSSATQNSPGFEACPHPFCYRFP